MKSAFLKSIIRTIAIVFFDTLFCNSSIFDIYIYGS